MIKIKGNIDELEALISKTTIVKNVECEYHELKYLSS
jgi:hypothetical protein